ncbi:MAG: c-type cytochrome [Bacteroidetes bacterium]|nr:c-type cytochrome [Bacteroidota bacterium]
MKFKTTCIFFLIWMIIPRGVCQVLGADWPVPEPAKSIVCAASFSKETVSAGDALYQKNCKACHGDPGKQNWAKIVPVPGDPASAEFQKQTDGEIFFRITTGKVPMPSFQPILPEQDRWNIISYIRSFNPQYIQPTPQQKVAGGGRTIRLLLACDYNQKRLYVVCNEITKDKTIVPVENADIQLLAKRYFGNLQIGHSVHTNKIGLAVFDFPQNLPGDKFGMINLIARLNDETGILGEATTTLNARIGVPTQWVSLTAPRAMWNTRDKSPLWLTFTFSLCFIIVWGFIIYILVSLGKMKRINAKVKIQIEDE